MTGMTSCGGTHTGFCSGLICPACGNCEWGCTTNRRTQPIVWAKVHAPQPANLSRGTLAPRGANEGT
jgi:hypothetical protein